MTNNDYQIRKKKVRMQALLKANRLQEARTLCMEMCAINQLDTDTWLSLGTIYTRLGELKQAEACFRQAITIQPLFVQAHNSLGIALRDQTRLIEAAESFRQAIHIKHDYFDALSNLGAVLLSLGESQQAVDIFRTAFQIKSGSAETYANLGSAFYLAGILEEAAVYFRKAIKLKPGHADLHDALGNLLCYQGKIDEAIVERRHALRLKPDNAIAHSNLLFTLHYKSDIDPAAMFAEHRRWAEIHEKRETSIRPPPTHVPDPEKQLRVAYVSSDFRQHSVSYFIESILSKHDHSRFEIICYSDVKQPDATTERLKSLANQWRPIAGMSDAQLLDLVRSDKIDILVDLAGHTRGNRLRVFSQKPAPLQMSYLGYPNTTGLTAMDYRITDTWADPPGQTEHLHIESLVRLPGGFLCYQPPSDAPAVALPPFQENGYVTFGSFNNVAKVNPEIIGLWARILNAVPNSRFTLKFQWQSDIPTRERYIALFTTHGIDQARLSILPPALSTAEHLSQYARVDIALDTFPYGGTTTTCEALWMGVPVITLAGPVHMSRVGTSLLTQVGISEYIAITPDDYVNVAAQLANDTKKITQLRTTLRERVAASSLCDAKKFIHELEDAYRTIWKTWCKNSRE